MKTSIKKSSYRETQQNPLFSLSPFSFLLGFAVEGKIKRGDWGGSEVAVVTIFKEEGDERKIKGMGILDILKK